MLLEGITREARISECGRYRYTLMRRWGAKPGGLTWIMLNPSTADAEQDDPTIRRCMTFTQKFGYDSMVVVNLFALRATDPRELLDAENPLGPENGLWVRKACHQGALVVAAWGSLKKPLRQAAEAISKTIMGDGYSLKCLGTTRDGHPRHPLYVEADTSLMDWRGPKSR